MQNLEAKGFPACHMLKIPTQEIPPEASGFLSIGNINISIMQEDISLVEKKAITII